MASFIKSFPQHKEPRMDLPFVSDSGIASFLGLCWLDLFDGSVDRGPTIRCATYNRGPRDPANDVFGSGRTGGRDDWVLHLFCYIRVFTRSQPPLFTLSGQQLEENIVSSDRHQLHHPDLRFQYGCVWHESSNNCGSYQEFILPELGFT